MLLEHVIILACTATLIALGIGGFALFHRGNDPAFKRRWWPRYSILSGVLFALSGGTFAIIEVGRPASLVIALLILPASALITILNIKLTRFCDGCGAPLITGASLFSPSGCCPKCRNRPGGHP